MDIGIVASIMATVLLPMTVFLRLRVLWQDRGDQTKRKFLGEKLFFTLGLCPYLFIWFIRGGTEAEQVVRVLCIFAISLSAFIVAGACWFIRMQHQDDPLKNTRDELEWPSPQNRMP